MSRLSCCQQARRYSEADSETLFGHREITRRAIKLTNEVIRVITGLEFYLAYNSHVITHSAENCR